MFSAFEQQYTQLKPTLMHYVEYSTGNTKDFWKQANTKVDGVKFMYSFCLNHIPISLLCSLLYALLTSVCNTH